MGITTVPKEDIDLEKLGLINQGLVRVDGKLARRYKAVLKKELGLGTDFDEFRVDKRGLSPELCVEFKHHKLNRCGDENNYLNIGQANRFMVVVSPDQALAPLILPESSYDDDFLDIVYRLGKHTIADITAREALFGEIDNGITIYNSAYDLLQQKTVELSLDTLAGTVSKILLLKDLSKKLDEGDNALNEDYVGRMAELVEEVGDIRYRHVSGIFPIKRELHCFYMEAFLGVYCLRNIKAGGRYSTLFVTHHQPKKELPGEIINIGVHSPELIDILHSLGFLKYDPGLIRKRKREIEDAILLEEGEDIVELPKTPRKRLLVQLADKLPTAWMELDEIEGILKSSSHTLESLMKGRSKEAKLKLSHNVDEEEIIEHMFAELDQTDPVRMYLHNRKKLVTEFPDWPLNVKRHVAAKLLKHKASGGQ